MLALNYRQELQISISQKLGSAIIKLHMVKIMYHGTALSAYARPASIKLDEKMREEI